MTQHTTSDSAERFFSLHRGERPLVLYNIWDAGSAKTVAAAGAQAIATGSASLAAALGYEDGECIPFELLLRMVERITASVDVPVSVDFESGFARAPTDLMRNTTRVLETGAVGVNFEDQAIGGDDLYSINEQCERISALLSAASSVGRNLFVNARTDLFLRSEHHQDVLDQAIGRGKAYASAGAHGFFVPGLSDAECIERLVKEVALPINVMATERSPGIAELKTIGVARVSYGPAPYRRVQQVLAEQAAAAIST